MKFNNPYMEGADPFLLLYDNTYYLYATDAQDGFRVFVSRNLTEWEDVGYCLRKGDAIGDSGFWAPEVTVRNGKFYMVYVADEHLAVACADSPLGPFVQQEKKWLSEEKAIDGHFFTDDDGTVWLYYVRLRNGNEIYAAKMNDVLSTMDEANETFLLKAEEEWECKDCLVAEGPFVLKHKGKYYLSYSANHTRSPYYAVGYAVADSPCGPFVKYKGNPILHKDARVNGVGHHSFAQSLDGKSLICAYHCHYSKTQFSPRLVCFDYARFAGNPDGGADLLVIDGPTVDVQLK